MTATTAQRDDHSRPVTLPITVVIPTDTCIAADLSALPAARGIALFEDDQGRTLAIAISADVRRLVRRRLTALDDARNTSTSRPGPDWRAMTRTIRATRCGSAFEADVLWLRLAQHVLPHAATAASDRWQCWCVHVDPDAEFPWFTKTRHPGTAPTGDRGMHLGPLPDKHAAGRCIDALNGMFDLCRYRHILVQAPHATACAYKEIGRCPAPCDGSIGMDAYRQQVRAAMHHVCGSLIAWRDQQQADMQQAVAAMDYELAGLFKRRLEDAGMLDAPKYRFMASLERFCFVSIQQSTSDQHAQVLLIHGGTVRSCMDVTLDISAADTRDVISYLVQHAHEPVDIAGLTNAHHQMMGLISHHLFLPSRLQRGSFARPADLTPAHLRRLIRTAAGRWRKPRAGTDAGADDDERLIESIDA